MKLLFRYHILTLICALLFFVAPIAAQKNSPPTSSITATARTLAPSDVLGFTPGDDRKLASWSSIVDYFKRLDTASDRVKFEELGRTTMDAPFVLATISAPENLARLDRYKEIQRKLADPRTLGRTDAQRDRAAAALMREGKTIVLITCGIHSNEVGSTLSSTLIAHRLASSNDPVIQNILRDTIVLLVPSLNPDGVDIIKRWYDRTLGTPYEGTDPPELYHKYVGHDNNRDWYAFTQIETQLTVDKIHNVWHPQIVHDIHQQGAFGARLFLPPYLKPVEPNVPREIIEGYTELGKAMARDLGTQGFRGITWDSSYDAWTPARAYSHYHGGVRILSETASARLASPRTVKFEDLRNGDDRGYNPRVASPNFPDPWQGGEWRLRDITNYMTSGAFSLMKHAAENREAWLQRFYKIGKDAVRERKDGEVWGFRLKIDDNTPLLLEILERAGVGHGFPANEKPSQVESVFDNTTSYPSQTVLIPMEQPYAVFAKALLERQNYPNLLDANKQPIPPYDVTAHTLSLLMNNQVEEIQAPFKPNYRKNAKITHSISDCVLEGRKTIALYKSYVPSMDEGWTRHVLEPCFEYESIFDKDIKAGNFEQKNPPSYLKKGDLKYRVVVIPDHSPRLILNGHAPGTMPEEFTGGIGAEGVKALREFVEAGGTLVTLNRASRFAIAEFKLPVRDITENLKRTEFYVPGSILRTELDTAHPLAAGMPKESIAWVEDSPVFEIGDPARAGEVRIVARYPANASPLLSGWLLGEERLRGRAALVEVKMGKGRVVLFGFRPQYRGQSLATYPLLFNALK